MYHKTMNPKSKKFHIDLKYDLPDYSMSLISRIVNAIMVTEQTEMHGSYKCL